MAFSGLRLVLAVVLTVLSAPFLPPLAFSINWVGAYLVEQRAYGAAAFLFRYLHGFGNATAANNLGVLCVCRSISCDGLPPAQTLFAEAHARGVLPAAYNLAWTLPSGFDTPADLVERGLKLLQGAVAQGDVHAGVLLAERLYFKNRSSYVDDRQGLKLEVLSKAAATGDADYRYVFATELLDQAQKVIADEGRASQLVRQAFEELVAVDEAGDTRAAAALGSSTSFVDKLPGLTLPPAVMARTPLDWKRRAVRDGRIIAHCCSLGFALEKAASVSESHDLAGKLIVEALPHLEVCAGAQKDRGRPSPPFGKPALYVSKILGTRSSLANSPGHANMILGDLYAEGRSVLRDLARARRYFERALTVHQFSEARERLSRL